MTNKKMSQNEGKVATQMGVSSQNRGKKTPKMDGENHGKPYEQMDDLGGFYHPYFWKHSNIFYMIQNLGKFPS